MIPSVIAFGGPVGAGKSAVAVRLADRLRYCAEFPSRASSVRLLRSDVFKKQLVAIDPMDRLPTIYSDNERYYRLTYEVLHAVTTVISLAGDIAVLDASYCQSWQRRELATVVARNGFRGFWLDASIEKRIERIRYRKSDASDAGVELAMQQKIDPPHHETMWRYVDTECLSVEAVVLGVYDQLCETD